MQLFYTPDMAGDEYTLDEAESKHCLKVLRLNTGSIIHLTDGKGNLYKAEITNTNLRACKLKIVETLIHFEKRDYYLHMAVAPTKNIDRFEWFIEKATEIGIDEISPIFTAHSERKQVNTERLERIVVSALKQSVKAYKPVINKPLNFDDFIHGHQTNSNCFIAHCRDSEKHYINQLFQPGKNATILIGPEGDFSELEIELALKKEFLPVSLGTSRLRTETAAVTACIEMNIINRK